ncbi:gibberellin 3-beta-dioxygenase 1-like [Actinidia eriantha]|uniref:gibberellin 3-beta-dioxygenase 1-like n=1 Tax=Actinidia eriantha TaxID=165200 RepID=UPI00258FB14C|nr:gibberellin 3-beta-dioxygenase 1-like [Actinidia eriantha]
MSNLCEVYRKTPLKPHHIIPLDFQSVKSVPDSHVWSDCDDYSPTEVLDSHLWSESHNFPIQDEHIIPNEHPSIPIIDLTDPNAIDYVGQACHTWGIFHVTNHGLPLGLFEEVETEARRLFSLPAQQKMKALRSPGGATGYGSARMAPFFSKSMWHEGFTIMGSSVDHARVLWPNDYNRFCEVMDEYQKQMKALAHKLFLMILTSMGLSEEEQNWALMVQSNESNALQLNSYPPCPDPTRTIGLAPHTDSLLLTILHQSDSDGLEVLQAGVGWVRVRRAPGSLTINVGDLMHVFSNGKFKSVCHRAVVKRTHHRVSIAYFYGLPADSVVGPLLKLGPPRYRALTVEEYLGMKAQHLEKALSLIRI